MRVKLWAPSLHGCITNRCSYAHPMQSIVNFIILMVNLVTVPYHFFNICSTYSWTWSTRSWNDENCMTNYNIGRCCLCVCVSLFSLLLWFIASKIQFAFTVRLLRKFVPRLCNATGTRSSGSSLTVFIFCRFIGLFVCKNVVFSSPRSNSKLSRFIIT